jgi:peptidoglycan hydrolase-like protein with peptidoglycan-binding domain
MHPRVYQHGPLATIASALVVALATLGTTATVEARTSAPLLRQGSTGFGVQCVQVAMNEAENAGLQVDGIFGPRTRQAVMDFQRAEGLAADGIVGPQTGDLVWAWDAYQPSWQSCYDHVPTTE